MKNKRVCLFIAAVSFFFCICLFSTTSYAGSQKLSEIGYDVTLNEDGSAKVIENWNVEVTDTNTLFKTFAIDSSKYGAITDVNVKEIKETGNIVEFEDTGVYAYHVKKDGFYALSTNSREFEIAWGVSVDGTQKKNYQISYTIQDAVKNYNDCSEFYWQFIGNTNGIPAKLVKGTVRLPRAVTSRENLKVWAHGPLNGNINIANNQTVSFEVENLKTETMVEVRVVTTENIFTSNEVKVGTNKLQNILTEEGKWADRANNERKRVDTIVNAIIIIGFITIIVFIFLIVKYAKALSNAEKIKPDVEYDYFRDIPNEDATPAEAAYLYYFDNKFLFNSNLSKIVSATILNLALSKVISFEKGTKKDEVYIILENEHAGSELKETDRQVYEMLLAAKGYTAIHGKQEGFSNGITMKDIEKYAKKHDKAFLGKVESLEKIAKELETENGNYNEKLMKACKKWENRKFGYFFGAFFCLCFAVFVVPLFAIIPCIICGVLCSKIAKKTRNLTQQGTNEQAKWKALKRYMEEFSLLNEREVPELVLWEKYLVYATAFGIADKVLEQLKVRYPEIMDETYMINNGYSYIYMMNTMNFNRSIQTGMQRAYSASLAERAARNYSSRWWRTAEASQAEAGGRTAVDGRNGRKIN